MTPHHMILCRSCAPGHDGLAKALGVALTGLDISLSQTECMSGCTRPVTVAFRASGKTAYLFGDLGQQDVADLTQFARLYLQSPDGNFADARLLGGLRSKAIARIPDAPA